MSWLFLWLRSVSLVPAKWHPDSWLAYIPSSRNLTELKEIQNMRRENLTQHPKVEDYIGKPVRIDAEPLEQMKEMFAKQEDICL
jgi:hypothetical protein